MRIKEISTLVGAGVLSLAAVMILEREGSPKPVVPAAAQEIFDFEDTSSLVEYSPPAPTAEPPVVSAPAAGSAESEGKKADAEEVFVSVGGADPVPAVPGQIPAGEGGAAPVVAGVSEPLPEPDDETADSGGLSDSFMKAVAAATEKVGIANTQVAENDAEEAPSIIEETPDGFWLRQAKLNDVFQHLAQLGNFQFFHNNEADGPSYVVTGQLMNDDPIRQMEELALMYGLTIHQKGNTVYALTSAQLSQLPTEPFRYQLKYLRPKDIEQIKLILQPFLTPGSGIIEFETKTNTLIVMDNARKLDALAMFLEQIDRPKQQIAIETRILRVRSSSRNRIGVDWSGILGDTGLTIGGAASLNALFNLPEIDTVSQILTAAGTGSTPQIVKNNLDLTYGYERSRTDNEANLVLTPLQLSAVLRALNAGGLANQESSPTLIAEDNEEGLISIIDRIPIITATVSETTAGQNITEEVRYKIDADDPVGNPIDTREVGVTVAVTPTILPDGTIRMALRPRSAQVVDFVESPTGNLYPRVNESTVTTTARVPNGHSLLIGGFYEEVTNEQTNKVPFLGDLPAVNLLFKSTDRQKEHTSLVFIVTPKLYRPEVPLENDLTSHEIHDSHILPANHDYPDPATPGFNYRTNMRHTARAAVNRYEPDAPSSLLLPEHPYNRPQSLPVDSRRHDETPAFAHGGDQPSVTVRPVGEGRKPNPFGKLFGGNKKNQVP
jgi:type II secretory pathway component GspD/PulD (secretin)